MEEARDRRGGGDGDGDGDGDWVGGSGAGGRFVLLVVVVVVVDGPLVIDILIEVWLVVRRRGLLVDRSEAMVDGCG